LGKLVLFMTHDQASSSWLSESLGSAPKELAQR